MLEFLKHEVQYIALAIMGITYIAKILWILRFKPMRERTPSKGNERKAILYSYLNILTPWSMESTRRKWYKWVEFSLFHIGIAFAILASFFIPEWPYLMTPWVQVLFKIFIALSFFVVLIRLGRRMFSPVNRVISHPDDYFSLFMMIAWFFVAFFAMDMNESNWMFGAYFIITALLIAYVPFSKMSHYILWPFTRFYFGKTFGHRGVYPKSKDV
jgi:nitrate reductase gamma subunit